MLGLGLASCLGGLALSSLSRFVESLGLLCSEHHIQYCHNGVAGQPADFQPTDQIFSCLPVSSTTDTVHCKFVTGTGFIGVFMAGICGRMYQP